jgi:hypothetical protein
LPVRSEDRIVGLLPLSEFRTAPIDPLGLTAESVMHSLDQSILITSGSSVLRYIEEAEASPCRLVIRGTRIAGIVTISDLQKLAVRPALFVLVTHLELLMAALIRAHFRERADDWLVKLGDRRDRVEQNWQKLKADGLEIDLIAATQFADKRQILVKSGLFQCSRSRAEREFGAIENLRDGLAHANNYASTRQSALGTIGAVRLARQWIAALQEVLDGHQDAHWGRSTDQ